MKKRLIELTKDTMCAHDKHELVNYPCSWFKAKPTLPAGTVLEVKEEWSNFYGTYYRCETADGEYDIPIENANDVSEIFQMKFIDTEPGQELKSAVEDLKRAIENKYSDCFRAAIDAMTFWIKKLDDIYIKKSKGGEK